MAPIRRYLRITKYSVLECRIYLDNPALAHTWLLNPRKSVLPRVIDAVRPYVLPKLREERERSRKKTTKKKGIKDVVVQDDFEVSIFLTETSTRHSLLTKHKHFHDTTQTKLTTNNSGRLMGATNEAPIDVDAADVAIRREESDGEDDPAAVLAALPALDQSVVASRHTPKRARSNTMGSSIIFDEASQSSDLEFVSDDNGHSGGEDDDLFVQEDAEDMRPPPAKRRRKAAAVDTGAIEDRADKKKLAMDISYEGFSIYGRVLCLVVKRRDTTGASLPGHNTGANTTAPRGMGAGGKAMMENFIISTQVPAGMEAA
ncbi:hypothetical protein F5Y15DRAFT_314032 [Xylariaceae sp. FL0016]|nr:hypothetical protein F5Y15DRAFT_314032 [Xylariaceae sp. FL0016]